MIKNVTIVSDFLSTEILGNGGAQLYNEELFRLLSSKYNVTFLKSANASVEILNNKKDNFFIISNFMLLGEKEKLFIEDNLKYCILEHDHKYCSTNNPALFSNFTIPEEYLINKSFFKKAYAVLFNNKFFSNILLW